MQSAWALALLVAGMALAGCTDGGSIDGFTTKAPSEPGGAYTFRANGPADEYRWDLGDRLTKATGREVQHAYDFTDGTVTVTLTTIRDGAQYTYREQVVVGPGDNRAPGLILEAERNWTVVGETVRFSGASSVDPEGDNLRYTWSCFVKQEGLQRQAAHAHGGPGGGVPFATPGSGSGLSRLASAPLPTADRVVAGDMCDSLQTGGPSLDATVEGAFDAPGIYEIILTGSDGPNPTISTTFTLYVSDPSERPAPVQQYAFSGTLVVGGGGAFQDVANELGLGEVIDLESHGFDLPVNALNLTATLTYDAGVANEVQLSIVRGSDARGTTTENGGTIDLAALKEGGYAAVAVLNQGAQVNYSVDIVALMDLDPTKYY